MILERFGRFKEKTCRTVNLYENVYSFRAFVKQKTNLVNLLKNKDNKITWNYYADINS